VKTNVLYYGDNLDILRRYIDAESVDLIYLDPPFNSNRDYNVIFKDESGRKSDAQLVAFEDTWHWGPDASARLRVPDQHRAPRGPRARHLSRRSSRRCGTASARTR
jgi:adenine specific DNA methylase Mod